MAQQQQQQQQNDCRKEERKIDRLEYGIKDFQREKDDYKKKYENKKNKIN